MKIETVKINNFGKLNNKEIKLKDGINIIYGKNESGKSTLLNFIKSILYGISRNKKSGEISDLDRYMPWKIGEFSGKIKYELDNGEKYEVYRDFTKKSPKVFNKYSEEVTNEYEIDKNLGSKFFYEQTKVDKELFLSTVVSEQQKVKLNKNNQYVLVQKLTNLIGTGNDNISYNKTISKLNKKIVEEIGTSRTQDKPINRIYKQIKEREEEIKELEKYSDKKYSIAELKEEKQMVLGREKEKLELIKKLKEIREKEKLEKEKVNINNNIKLEYEEKIKELENEYREIINAPSKATDKKRIYILIALVIIINSFTISMKNTKIIIIGVLITILSIIIWKVICNKEKKNEKNTKHKYTDKILNEIDLLKTNCEEKKEEIVNIKNAMQLGISRELDAIRIKYINKIEVLELNNLINEQELNKKMDITQENINSIKLYLQTIEIEQKNIEEKLEKMSSLKEELEELENEYNSLQEDSQSINLAKEVLTEAYSKMKNEVTPKFTKFLSENISKITNGKYSNVKFNEENGLIVEMQNGDYIPAEYLSMGTIDQLYLSLRLSATREIVEEKMPIILDEAFAFYDEERLKNILRYISDTYKDRQIIILTCTNREEKIMKNNELEYNLVNI